MTTTIPTPQRQPGRPRKPAPVVEEASVQEQPAQPQYTIAKLTAHMLAGEIHRLHQEGEDLTPVHEVSDAIRAVNVPVTGSGSAEPSVPAVEPHKIAELKAAVESVKLGADRPRTFAVSYLNKRGALKVAHGTEYADGEINVNGGVHNWAYEDTMAELRESAKKYHGDGFHVDYTDEP